MLLKLRNIKYLYIRIILSLLVLGMSLFFVLTNQNFDTEYNKAETFTDIKPLQLQDSDVIKQTIIFDHKTVHSIGISAVNRSIDCAGYIEISLTDSNGNEVWAERTDANSFALRNIKWYRLNCDVNENQTYILNISAKELKGAMQFAAIAPEYSASGADNVVFMNRVQQEGLSLFVEMTYSIRLDIISRIIILVWTFVLICHICAFEVMYADKRKGIITIFSVVILAIISAYLKLAIYFEQTRNCKIFAGMMVVIVLAIMVSAVMLIKRCQKVELYFILFAVLFGTLYTILLPPFSSPDEDIHFIEAYRLSNVMMMNAENDRYGITYMRECDAVEYNRHLTNDYFVDTISKLLNGNEDLSKNFVRVEDGFPVRVPITVYIPQALGITAAKMLQFNHVRLVYSGRLMNFLFFVVITALAIRMMPYGKWIIFAICQIPLVMEVVTSYSYDTITLAMTFLIVSYVLRLIEYKKQITWKQLAVLVLLCAVYAPLKPIYIPIIALVFIIPNKRISDISWKSILIKTSIFLCAIVATLAVYKGKVFSMWNISNEAAEGNIAQVQYGMWEADLGEVIQISDQTPYPHPNLSFFMENPFDIIESYAGAILNIADDYILSAFGKYLGWYDVVLPTYVAITMMILLYISFVHEDYNIIAGTNQMKRCWAMLMICGCWVAAMLACYLDLTGTEYKSIFGVQGRYFIPSFAGVVLLLQGKHSRNDDADCSIVMIAAVVNVMALLGVIRVVWIS